MERSASLDALRGLAVMLMVIQHLGVWFWRGSFRQLAEHPIIVTLNGIGGLGAPLFVTLAGAGAWYLFRRRRGAGTAVARGLLVLLLGYALNLAARQWFSPGSWYVLHLIGLGLVLSPLLCRIPTRALLALALVVVLVTPVVQHLLGTRMFISTAELSNTHRPFGPLRLALAEGHFPVLPWLAFFVSGVVAARWVEAREWKALWWLAGGCLAAGAALVVVGAAGLPWAGGAAVKRFFLLRTNFYPGYPPLLFLLQGFAFLALGAFGRLEQRSTFRFPRSLVCLGRASLTILFVHILVFRELGIWLGWRRVFSEPATVAITVAALVGFGFLAVQWERGGYRYGLEWLIRVVTRSRGAGAAGAAAARQ
jgi:uncharacterized membrane protein